MCNFALFCVLFCVIDSESLNLAHLIIDTPNTKLRLKIDSIIFNDYSYPHTIQTWKILETKFTYESLISSLSVTLYVNLCPTWVCLHEFMVLPKLSLGWPWDVQDNTLSDSNYIHSKFQPNQFNSCDLKHSLYHIKSLCSWGQVSLPSVI